MIPELEQTKSFEQIDAERAKRGRLFKFEIDCNPATAEVVLHGAGRPHIALYRTSKNIYFGVCDDPETGVEDVAVPIITPYTHPHLYCDKEIDMQAMLKLLRWDYKGTTITIEGEV